MSIWMKPIVKIFWHGKLLVSLIICQVEIISTKIIVEFAWSTIFTWSQTHFSTWSHFTITFFVSISICIPFEALDFLLFRLQINMACPQIILESTKKFNSKLELTSFNLQISCNFSRIPLKTRLNATSCSPNTFVGLITHISCSWFDFCSFAWLWSCFSSLDFSLWAYLTHCHDRKCLCNLHPFHSLNLIFNSLYMLNP